MPRFALAWMCYVLSAVSGPGVWAGVAAATETRVEFELITDRGAPLTAAHEWSSVLKDLGLDRLRIRAGTGGEQPSVQTTSNGRIAAYRVTGILTAGNQLLVPGGTFGLRDKRRLQDWISRLGAEGGGTSAAAPAAFGLTGEELVAVHDALAVKVAASTNEKPAAQVLQAIVEGLSLPVVFEPSARRVVIAAPEVMDELTGVASGTALAALLHPLGLALVPAKGASGPVQLRIVPLGQAAEFWPVGWPAEEKDVDLLPKLFDYLEADINDTPVSEVLEAVQTRLGVPLLVDRPALARRKIQLDQVRVSIGLRRTYYKRILDQSLAKARLKAQVRVDEAGRPLLWISSLVP